MPPGEVITGNRCGMAKEDEQTGRQGGLTPGRTRALMVLVAVIIFALIVLLATVTTRWRVAGKLRQTF